MKDKRVFKASEIDSNKTGWIADMSDPNGPVNPDCYWYFSTQKAAIIFCMYVDLGMDPNQAAELAICDFA